MMMDDAYPKVQAVAAPEVDAEVVFDFNEHGSWYRQGPVHDGWTLGSPTRLAEPGDARTAWGPRRPAFYLQQKGSRVQALKAQSTLARWLLQPEGWVLFQLDAMTPPVWLHMIGAEPQDLQFDLVKKGTGHDVWTLGVSFDADPFLYGERVTVLDDETVTMHPGTGLVADLGVAHGDAPAPLRLSVDVGTNHGGDLWHTATAALPEAAPGNGVIRRQLGATDDGMTYSPGGAQPDSAERVTVGGVPYWRFTKTGGQSYISGQVGTSVPPGTYRAFLRVSTAATASVFRIGFGTTINFFAGLGPTVTVDVPTTDTGSAWIDFGTYNLPSRLPHGLPASKLTRNASAYIHVERLSGSGSIDIGGLVLVPVRLVDAPADARALATEPRTGPISSGLSAAAVSLEWDGTQEVMWAEDSANGAIGRNAPSVMGGWPRIVPAAKNTLVLMRSPAPGVSVTDDSPAHAVQVTASYHPQWLYLPSEEV